MDIKHIDSQTVFKTVRNLTCLHIKKTPHIRHMKGKTLTLLIAKRKSNFPELVAMQWRSFQYTKCSQANTSRLRPIATSSM